MSTTYRPGHHKGPNPVDYVQEVWRLHMRLNGLVAGMKSPYGSGTQRRRNRHEAAQLGAYLAELREGWRVWARENPGRAEQCYADTREVIRPIYAFLRAPEGALTP